MKVFWSWQSDHPGRISRHFIRDALAQAIASLNESADIEDAVRPEVTLDQDRQGVPGSPDLARTIFEKIDASQVFVADVTPVGRTTGKPTKKLTNPNVAIELGYALRAVTDRGLLMVLNEHYGKQEHLPFDLRHKAGPIRYRLGPEASVEEIATQRARLVGQLKTALRDMRKHVASAATQITPFVPTPSTSGDAARFVEAGEIIVNEQGPGGDTYRYAMPSGPLLYLRLTPTKMLEPLRRAEAVKLVKSVEPFYDRPRAKGMATNAHGALSYSSNHQGQLVLCGTQLFLNRELWGFDSVMLRGREDRPKLFPMLSVESTFALRLPEYLRLATEKLGMSPPFTVEAGATGVKDFGLLMPSNFVERNWGPVHSNQIVWRDTIASLDASAVDQVLLAIFETIFDAVGRTRPPSLHGFPGETPGAIPTG
jgi:hypothetical protein